MTEWRQDPVLQDGGECGALMRALDWSDNPLGAPATWSKELRTVLGIALGSKQPMLIVWGPDQITLYNDGYAAMCGVRHPGTLGRPYVELWFDIWDVVEPIISAAYNGVGTSMEDIEFTMMRNSYPEETHFAFSYTPVRDSDGIVLGMFCTCTETTGEVLLRRQHKQERERLLQVFDQAIGAIAVLEGPHHRFSFANPDYLLLAGRRDVVGMTVAEALPEVVDQGFIDLLDRVYSSGEAYTGKNIEIDLHRSSGEAVERRVVDFLYQPIRDAGGKVEGIFVHALDVTEHVAARQQQLVLNRELGHRMKNQLALVQAIINQTLRSASDLQSAGKSLRARVGVLADAHDLLIAGETGRSTVGDIVRRAIAPHDPAERSRFRIEGPLVVIAERPALSLSLIVHELSTNATKYGALSNEDGFVRVSWEIDRNQEGKERFIFGWSEYGGPPVTKPFQLGSGSRLIQAGLAGTLECNVTVAYAPEGLKCELAVEFPSFQSER